jgi:type IV pilus biogenesis protein CpaD/CtpE
MNRSYDIFTARRSMSACLALMASVLAGCNAAPKEAAAPPPPSTSTLYMSNPAVQNNQKIPAFIRNGGLERLDQSMRDRARALREAQKKQSGQ